MLAILKRYNAWSVDYTITVNGEAGVNHILSELMRTIEERTHFRQSDRFQITVSHPNLTHPITSGVLLYRDAENAINQLVTQIERIITSNESITLDECTFNVRVVTMP